MNRDQREQGPTHDLDSMAGVNPATAGLTLLLSEAGVTGADGAALSEPMVLCLAGGLGAGVFSFRYEAEDLSSFFVAGRHLWQDDLAFVRAFAERCGLGVSVQETAGAKAAHKHLVHAVSGGRSTLVWVDMAALPYRSMPASWDGGGYHVVVVHEVDEQQATATLSDLGPERITVPLDELNTARARIRKHKNRVLTLDDGQSASIDLEPVLRSGLSACRDGLLGGRMANFTLKAFETWADRLAGNRSKDGWERLFPPGKHLWTALTSTYDFVEHYGSGGGLLRLHFARGLAEAAERLGAPSLSPLAERYRDLASRWTALARAALPDEIEPLAHARRLYDRKADLYAERGAEAADEIAEVWTELRELGRLMATEFALDESQASDLRADLQGRLRDIVAAERDALDELGVFLDSA